MPETLVAPDFCTARVLAPDGVRLIASAADDATLIEQIVSYVANRCDDVLWPSSALEVHRLIAVGELDEAIAVYFANVGKRWDDEWLEIGGRGSTAEAPPTSLRRRSCCLHLHPFNPTIGRNSWSNNRGHVTGDIVVFVDGEQGHMAG